MTDVQAKAFKRAQWRFILCSIAGVDFVCVLSGETTPADLEKYTGTPPAIVVETFDHVQD